MEGSYEIIIVDGDPVGDTISVVKNRKVIKILGKKGRGIQLNTGAEAASGIMLLFLHADTFLASDCLNHIVRIGQQSDVVGGAFDLGIKSERKVFRIIEGMVFLRTRLTHIPYGDQAIFVRREFFNRIGGFKEIPIMEDVELMQRIKNLGGKIAIVPSKALTSSRRWEKEGVVFCTLRNWVLITLFLMGVSPIRLSKFYR